MTETSYPTLSDVGRALEVWAPPGSAQSYDNVGLQVGDAARTVQRAVIALDLTPAVLAEAQEHEAKLIITHHPLLFKPLRRLTADGFVSSLALRLAEAGIALYSIHTNLDAAPGGVSFALADLLGVRDARFLDTLGEAVYKVATVVPKPHLDAVRAALVDAGAQRPAVVDAAEGARLEVAVSRWDLPRLTRALHAAHPDDDAAYDVYPVEQSNPAVGLGAVGRLDAPMPLAAFLQRVAERLGAGSLRYAGTPAATVETVAVCGGSGSSFIRQALRAGADAYVTADVTYHTFFDVLGVDGQPRMALIDAGHYETEALTESLLQAWLRERFPTVEWRRTATRTSPIDTFVPAPSTSPS